MSYLACRKCKKFHVISAENPLSFDKCENCGGILEFAGNKRELQFILNNIEMPKITYDKICTACKSKNPRETGTCLYCGNSQFMLHYDENSINNFNVAMQKISVNNSNNTKLNSKKPNRIGNILLSLIIGITDFIFLTILGINLVLGEVTSVNMELIQAHFVPLSIVVFLSLFIAGILSIFVIPKSNYKQSFLISALIGMFVGASCGIISSNIMIALGGLILFGAVSGFGGIIGSLLIKKLSKKMI